MAEAAEAVVTTPEPQAETPADKPVLTASIRETLAEKLREKRSKEPGTKPKRGEPEAKSEAKDATPDTKDAKPKTAETPDAEGKKADTEGEKDPAADKKPDEKDPEKEFQAQKREFARSKRRFEKRIAEMEGAVTDREVKVEHREKQVQAFEQRAQEAIASFKKDPVAWLNTNGVNVRDVLVRFANADSEDPRDRKLRELEERTAAQEEERKREAEERRREADERRREATDRDAVDAQRQIALSCQKAFETEGAQYPLLTAMWDPAEIGRMAMRVKLDEYRRTRKELADHDIFATLEEELKAQEAKLMAARNKKPATAIEEEEPSEPPDRVRPVAGSKSASPEVKPKRRTEDVTARSTALSTIGKPGRSRDEVLTRLTERLQSRTRSA